MGEKVIQVIAQFVLGMEERDQDMAEIRFMRCGLYLLLFKVYRTLKTDDDQFKSSILCQNVCLWSSGIFRNDIFEPNAEWLYGLR